nr:hypothetical protein [Tanacetum cinerariifolium]
MMLDTLRETFPDASIPRSFYKMKKVIRDLGLSYDKIDACPNDCMLYRKTNSEKTKCDICGTLRYKPSENDSETQSAKPHTQKKIAAKVLRHFPLKPRYLNFAKEPRNVRLGLASDGFNPFRNMSTSHTPRNNIDVYLEPLVEELKELWDDGVETYDASTKKNFEMHASLLWTISNFPAYANLSGWSTKDVMHIEKNVCESIVGTLMNLDGKTKDHIKARLDLQEMAIRPELHPQPQDKKKIYLPPACFSKDKKEKEIFCNVLKK